MNLITPTLPHQHWAQRSRIASQTPLQWLKATAAVLLLIMSGSVVFAASVTLTTSDAGGTTSFNTAGHWSNLAAPSAGNTYSVSGGAPNGVVLRTPAPTTSGNNYIFLGDSLTINSGGTLLGKIGNNTAGSAFTGTITITNLILNGGWVHQADGNNDSDTLVVAGNVNVTGATIIGAIGGTANNSGSFNTLEFTAPISGSGALQVSGPGINGGQDTGVTKLSAANPYSGTITVSNGNNAVIASAINRALQLNNLNALSNATLNLDSVTASPVSFVSGVNIGAFNVGALTGKASQALADTAGAAVTLSVGGNNASTAYWGVLSGVGSLVKTGSGTLTLSNANTYTGNTAVNAGTLQLSGGGSLASGNVTIATGATLDVANQTVPVLAANQNLLGTGTVNGSLTTVATSKIYPGTDGTVGTITFNNNLTNVSGSAFNLDVSTSASSGNDLVTVTGALALNNTTLNIQALGGGANLDMSADYVLITAASLSGIPNSAVTWVGTQPANAGNFTVVASGTQVKLHYSAGTPLIATGSASPATVTRNQSTLLTIAVTPGAFPASTGIAVTANLTPIGGSAAQVFYDDGTHGDVTIGDGTYSFNVTVAANTAAGNLSINGSVTDAQSRIATPTIALSVVTSSLTWSGGGANDNWNSNPNWVGGIAPGYVGDTLTFAGATRLTPNVEANYSVTDVTFDGSAGNFVVGASGGTLALTGSGIANNSANAQTLNVHITTAAAVSFNAVGGNLTLGQSITNSGNWITVGGDNNTTFVGEISGAGGLSKDGNGVVILNGTNSYTGGTLISAGTMQIAGAGLLGGGNYAGRITNFGVFQYSSSTTQTLSGVISFNGLLKDGSGTLILSGVNTYFGDTIISNGVLRITGSGSLGSGAYAASITDNGTFEHSSAANQILSGVISGSGGLLKNGSGTLTLNGANTYAGATVVTAGTLVYNPVNVTYPTISALSVSNAAVTVNAGTGTSLPVGSLSLNNSSILNLNYDFSGGNPAAVAVSILTAISAPGAGITINIGGVGAAVGQFPLISYVGAALPNINNFALGVLPPGVTASLVNNTGSKTIDLNVTAVVTTTWIPLAQTDPFGTSSFNSGTSWADFNAPSAVNGYYTKTFAVRSPADTNPYTFAGAALSVDPTGRFLMKGLNGQVVTVNNLILNGGIVDYANVNSDNFVETLAGNITVQPGLTSYLGAIGGAGVAETLFITAAVSGNGNLQVGGPEVNGGQDIGTVVLSGANTYTGNITVNAATLLVNSSVGGGILVKTNAGFGGIGVVAGAITVAPTGRLLPGIPAIGALTRTIGHLTVGGGVTIDGTVLVKIDRGAVTNSDRVVTTSIVANPSSILTVSNIGSTNLAAGDTFTLFSTPISGSFGTVTLPTLPNPSLFWTNKLAVDGTIAVLSSNPINPNPTNITVVATSGNLILSWPVGHTGWTLQVQTNSLSVGLSSNWVNVPGSTTTNSVTVPVVPANGAVFYRLKL